MKNTIIMFSLALVLLFLPITTYAAESSYLNNDIVTQESAITNLLVDAYNVRAPYTSNTFRPKTDYIDIIFGSWGTTGSYTYYLEEQRSNGSWLVIDSHTLRPGGSISTSAFVTPRNTYRVRVTTTDKYQNGMYIEVSETIYDS